MSDTDPAPAGARPWYHVGPVLNLADAAPDGEDASTADVYIYDVIGGWWGLSADDFVKDVAGLDVDHIVLHLNTPGGEVSEGVAIANMLRQHRADVKVYVDGMAASSGSVIAMAGDEVVMGLGSQMMIHNPKTWAVGDEDEMDKVGRMLKSTADAIASTYAAKAGGTVADWRAVMKAETWYSAEEAVTAGLADRVANDDDKGTATGKKITPGAKSGFWDLWDSLRDQGRLDLSAFHYKGRQNAPAPKLPDHKTEPSTTSASRAIVSAAEAAARIHQASTKKTTAAQPAEDRTTEGTTTDKRGAGMDPAKLREALGLAADAPDTEVTTAFAAAGLGQAGPPATPPEPTTEPVAANAALPAAAVPAGMRVISDSAWDQTQEALRKLQAREVKRERDERDQVITAAIKEGKFTVAQKDQFTKMWDASPETTRSYIASMQKNAALATSELGYADGDPDDDAGEFGDFDSLYPPHMRLVKSGKVA